jgi:hypothetical protein
MNEDQGAFGWAISNDKGERVATGMGPASGASPDSFRAEAYGMLVTLCFLRSWLNSLVTTNLGKGS